VKITDGYPTTMNDPELTTRMAPTLERVAGKGNARVAPPRCCVVCGGVTVCATEVTGWCGSCCDPRFTSCRPPL
jgi:hypothetical protein